MFYGRGGYSWETIYNMPIWLRRFTFKSIEQQLNDEAEAQEKAINKASGVEEAAPQSSTSVVIPHAVKNASYNTKVTKK